MGSAKCVMGPAVAKVMLATLMQTELAPALAKTMSINDLQNVWFDVTNYHENMCGLHFDSVTIHYTSSRYKFVRPQAHHEDQYGSSTRLTSWRPLQ